MMPKNVAILDVSRPAVPQGEGRINPPATIDKRAASGAFLRRMAKTDNEALIGARLFQSSNPEVARRLAGIRLKARSVAGGEMIFEPKDEADSIFLLTVARDAGPGLAEPLVQVRLSDAAAGRGPRFARIVRGDIFGEAELLTAGLDPRPTTRSSSARALTPARVIALPWSELAALFDLDPAIRARFLRLAARRFQEALSAQHSQGREDPDIVLADWLVEFAADLGAAVSNRVSFPKKLSQSEIADELGVSRETMSRRLKEWERAGLVTSSAGGLEVVDYSRLVRIAGLHSGRDRHALARAVADVGVEIDRGDMISARNVGADMLRYFPSSPELLHQMALAAARSGDREEAIDILKSAHLTAEGDLEALRARVARALENPFVSAERLATEDWIDTGFDDDEDEAAAGVDARLVERLVADIAGLEARLLKDAAFENAAAGDPERAQGSRRAYEAIWRRIGSWYAGINAAAMALVAGESKAAQALAAEILARLPEEPEDYWAAATRAEALFIAGDKAGAVKALGNAGAAADATDSAKASTMLQLRRLAPHLDLDAGAAAKALGLKTVSVMTGHMFRPADMDREAQEKASAAIRADAEAIFEERNVGNLFGALACGADVVVAEAALDRGIPFHAVVPFPIPRFVGLSVDTGDPKGEEGGWRRRFDDILARATSLTLVDDEIPLDRDLDGHFYHGFRFMAGLALMRADVLQTECRLLAVADESETANMAGANRAVVDWRERGRAADVIDFAFPRRAPAGRQRGAFSFRPVVLLWDVGDKGAAAKAIKKSGIAKKKEFSIVARSSRIAGEGTAIIAPDLEAAIRLAETFARSADGLRVICDFGPVLGANMKPDPKMIGRLKAGSDLPGFPTGRPLATLSFAAQAVCDFGQRLDVRAVGRSDDMRDGGGHARRRSGLAVYRLALKDEIRA